MAAPRILVWMLALAAQACAQLLVDEATAGGRTLVASFDQLSHDRSAPKLACSVRRHPAAIDYGLRVWSGFNVAVPARQLLMREGDSGAVAFRVTPRGAPAARKYFWQRFDIPPVPRGGPPPERMEMTLGGGFLLGRGDYSVELLLIDSRGQRCTDSWKVANRLGGSGVLTAPDTVEPLDAQTWPGFTSGGAGRVTIFLHAAPVWPRRYISKLSSWDRQILMSSLISLLRNTHYQSACLVIFDLERRRVLYRDPDFGRPGLRRLARQLAAVDLGTISVESLQTGAGQGAFLEEMLRAEVKDPKQSDAFVFLGTTWRAGSKLRPLPADLLESMAKIWFFAFRHPAVSDEDSVSSLVRQAHGKIFNIYRPPDLASAIRTMTGQK